MQWDAQALALQARLQQAGQECVIVGGAVRDVLRGQTPADYDLATSADTRQLLALFPGAVLTGGALGTVTVTAATPVGLREYEITPFRAEEGYTDGRHPDAVHFGVSLQEDLARRDFTVNAMAWDGRQLIDPFGGQADLQAGLVRAVGDPVRRFKEDALRILRAFRFASVLDFAIEEETLRAALACRSRLRGLSDPRIKNELQATLLGRAPQALDPFIAVGGLRWLGLRGPQDDRYADKPEQEAEKTAAAPARVWQSCDVAAEKGADAIPDEEKTADGTQTAAAAEKTADAIPVEEKTADAAPDGSKDVAGAQATAVEKGMDAAPNEQKAVAAGEPARSQDPAADAEDAAFTLAPLAKVPCRMLLRWWAFLTLLHADKKYFCARLGFSQGFYRDLVLVDAFFIDPADRLTLKRRAARPLPVSMEELLQAFCALDDRFAANLATWQEVVAAGEPCTLKDLAVSGRDLLALGLRGAAVGRRLQLLLEAVLVEPSLNRKATLLALSQALDGLQKL